MRCESCGDEDASVHLTQLLNGEMKKLHLCKDCASKHGVNVDDPVSLADLFLAAEPPGSAPPRAGAKEEPRCPTCHMRMSDFRKSSRLGCPACYESFSAELAPLIVGLHKSQSHAGKMPEGIRLTRDVRERSDRLSARLKAAIADEQFEEAARLRDELKQARDDSGEGA